MKRIPLSAAQRATVIRHRPVEAAGKRSAGHSHYECWFCKRHIRLVRLVRRLIERWDSEDVLTSTAPTLVRTLELAHAAIRLRTPAGADTVVSVFGSPTGSVVDFPIVHCGENVGVLSVSVGGSRTVSTAERQLLDEFTHGLATAVQVRRVTSTLHQARLDLVAIRDDERRRLRRDLHDGLGPVLAAATMRVETARALLAGDDLAAVEVAFGQLLDDLRGALADVRRMAETLEPSLVHDMGGLLSALQSQAVRFEQASRGRLVVRVEGGPLHGLPAEIEYAAYRMACEALTNVARHARARHCTVRLTVVGGCLQLEVTDDGKGLPRAPKPGLGLASMAERARELGGDCVIERRTPNGTRVLGRLPTVPPQR